MAASSVDVVQRGFAAYNAGDMQTFMALIHPDVEVYSAPEMINSGEYRGREGFSRWLAAWVEAWQSFRVEPIQIEAIDAQRVVVEARQYARGAGSGVEVEMDVCWAFEVEDDKARRVELHVDRGTAIAAVERWQRAPSAGA